MITGRLVKKRNCNAGSRSRKIRVTLLVNNIFTIFTRTAFISSISPNIYHAIPAIRLYIRV